MSWLNISKIIDCTEAEGPGKRFVIWVQGCLLRCPNCCNEEMQAIKPANIMSSDDIIELINQAKIKQQIEGITLLGGEPFLQAKGLAKVAQESQKLGLSVMCFTGYKYEHLLNTDTILGSKELLEHIDVLVDGPFVETLLENQRNWVGSSNQRFIYLSNFYNSDIETKLDVITQEWRISADGTLKVNGIPYPINFIQEQDG